MEGHELPTNQSGSASNERIRAIEFVQEHAVGEIQVARERLAEEQRRLRASQEQQAYPTERTVEKVLYLLELVEHSKYLKEYFQRMGTKIDFTPWRPSSSRVAISISRIPGLRGYGKPESEVEGLIVYRADENQLRLFGAKDPHSQLGPKYGGAYLQPVTAERSIHVLADNGDAPKTLNYLGSLNKEVILEKLEKAVDPEGKYHQDNPDTAGSGEVATEDTGKLLQFKPRNN